MNEKTLLAVVFGLLYIVLGYFTYNLLIGTMQAANRLVFVLLIVIIGALAWLFTIGGKDIE